MTLEQQLDHMRKLSAQFPLAGLRVVYTKGGTILGAALLEDPRVIVDHKAYWAAARGIDEARYLTAVLNSGTALQRIIPMQPTGWRDPRDFDNLVWELPVPEYHRRQSLHAELADAAAEAERRAAMGRTGRGLAFHAQAVCDPRGVGGGWHRGQNRCTRR
jgi:hypothetical protein